MHTVRYVSVADPGTLIRMFSIPDLESEFFPSQIPDPGSASKNLSILTQKIGFYALGNMIRVVNPGSGSCFFPIPDPGVKKAPNSGSATLPYVSLTEDYVHC
jgi:hypothetical protein